MVDFPASLVGFHMVIANFSFHCENESALAEVWGIGTSLQRIGCFWEVMSKPSKGAAWMAEIFCNDEVSRWSCLSRTRKAWHAHAVEIRLAWWQCATDELSVPRKHGAWQSANELDPKATRIHRCDCAFAADRSLMVFAWGAERPCAPVPMPPGSE